MKGTGASGGIGIGRAVILTEEKLDIVKDTIKDTEAEKESFRRAAEESIASTAALAEETARRIGEKEAEIINGHLMLLQDQTLLSEIEAVIETEKVCSTYAVETICNNYANLFASMEDELMQQRAADMEDIKILLQKTLLGIKGTDISKLPMGTILIAKDLTPSLTAGINAENVLGIVTELGGRTSHSAILARALEIPAVVAAKGIFSCVQDEDLVILDGETGQIFVNPDSAVSKEYEIKRAALQTEKAEFQKYLGRPAVTKDGHSVTIAANIGKPEDVDKVLLYGGEEIGLFRTEFLFMERTYIPSEEEQFTAYKRVTASMNGKPVIIRTLDIGGDKEVPYLKLEKEENPFLGYRAIRFCLDRKEDIFKPQIRALLRAGIYGDLRIMLPMVTCLEELREAKAFIEEVKQELEEEKAVYQKHLPLGIMVETAATSLMADVFAKEADFFSIGTNDLTQYTMAVDRGNTKVSKLYSSLNPAVLRSIRHIIECGHQAGISVGMCGEAASDPLMIPLLLSFGLDEFSMSASAMLRTKKLIAGYELEEVKQMAEKAMSYTTADEIRQFVNDYVNRKNK